MSNKLGVKMNFDMSKRLKYRHLLFCVTSNGDGEDVNYSPDEEDTFENIVYAAFREDQTRTDFTRILKKIITSFPKPANENDDPPIKDMPTVILTVFVENFPQTVVFDWKWSRDWYCQDHLFTEFMKCFSALLHQASGSYYFNTRYTGAREIPEEEARAKATNKE